MGLREEGFRFYLSPDRKEASWLHPLIRKELYPDWKDVTNMPTRELIDFIKFGEHLPHGPAECAAVQQELPL